MQLGCVSARRRERSLATAVAVVGSALVAALVTAPVGPARAASSGTAARSGTVWLCRPGTPDDPCAASRAATAMAADGTRGTGTLTVRPPAGHRFDCFYVYPTVSSERGPNADLRVQAEEREAAIDQASQFSQVCTVWVPVYRQATVGALSGLHAHGISPALRRAETVAYASLSATWRDFLAHHADGHPVVLIGHSQGAIELIRLIARQIDGNASVRRRLLVAILAGGNLQVPTGKVVGATFHHIPLCTRTTQTGCAIAWSAFPSQPPPDALFGRPGQGVSLQGGQTRSRGEAVACVDPAALGGGTGRLQPYFLTALEPVVPAVTTPWVTFPGLYTATCRHGGGATWLQVAAAPGDPRPVVGEPAGTAWGYHGGDVNLVLGNLVVDVATEEAAWVSAHH